MKDTGLDPEISAIFESAARKVREHKKWRKLGYICDPCDPLLPLQQPKAFYGENPQIETLIAKIIDFIREPSKDLLFLKGPRGSGKTIFAQIFKEYSQKLKVSANYQDASAFFTERTFQPNEALSFSLNAETEDIIFLDKAFHLHRSLPKLLKLKSPANHHSPKIIAILDSTEFEIYRRLCIQRGDKTYQHFLPMSHLISVDISNILQKRLHICYGDPLTPPISDEIIRYIANLSFGNPGIAIRILDETLRFSLSVEDIRYTFGINPEALNHFPTSKSPILREILVREVQNEFLPLEKREYIIHKELTLMMNKTKSTISHHLGDLLSNNLIYEQSTDRDKREKAYRPNKAIFGILEHLAFESTAAEDALITFEGINREK
ncbi:MAG: ATP-binding protein [Candidatus Heimdallarchaeota archaeon]|nr:MAG: ATP-binding protein [Candidatus Heimdallarchaeota archaeon]